MFQTLRLIVVLVVILLLLTAYRTLQAQDPAPDSIASNEVPTPKKGNPSPAYPKELVLQKKEGKVVVRVIVGTDGSVKTATIDTSSGWPSLDSAALSAIQKWRFSPALRNGTSIEAEVLVPFTFRIANSTNRSIDDSTSRIRPLNLGQKEVAELVDRFKDLVRVTGTPQPLNSLSATLCAPAITPKDHSTLVGKPGAAIHVFVSQTGIPAMLSRDSSVFPIGTIILKQKFSDSSAQNTILYTGMIKRDQGYNRQCGDWEFFTLSGDRKTIISRGLIESCIACHQEYSRTDFVTKQYPLER